MTPSFNALLDLVESVDDSAGPALGSGRPYLEFPPSEYGLRHSRACLLMRELGIDALVCAEPANVRYFTGLRSWFTALPPVLPIVAVITLEAEASTIIDTVTEKGSVEGASWISDPVLYGANDDPVDMVVTALRKRNLLSGTIGMELGWGRLPHLSPHDLDRLRKSMVGRVVDASQLLHAIRAIKSPAEVKAMKRAAGFVSSAFTAVCAGLEEGMTESQMVRIAAAAVTSAGGVDELTPNVFIFMSGPDRYRLPLLPATERRVRRGELISLDGGCSFLGYHSDFARGAVIGELDSEAAEQFAVAEEALEAAEAALKPGVPASDAWKAADGVLRSAGLSDNAINPHNIGHSIGLEHWELPTVARPDSEMGQVTVRPGMVLCVEPQFAGAHGDDSWARGLFLVEDEMLVTEGGVEVLTNQMPRSLYVARG